MPSFSGNACSFQTCRACSDYHYFLRGIGWYQFIPIGHFFCISVLCCSVHAAIFTLSALNAVAMEAVHAGSNFITASALEFVRQLRIDGQRTSHEHNIDFTVPDSIVNQIRCKTDIHHTRTAYRYTDGFFDF